MTSQALGDLVRKNRPSIVFLMETKNNKVKVETIRRSLKFDFGFYVDPEGTSGGLALWWNGDVDLEVESASKNLIHSIVKDNSSSSCWATTFVYGSPLHSGRDMVWEDMKEIARHENLPWLAIGDFNEVLSLEDKLGGNCPSQRRLASFHDMLNYCGLVDLDFKGPKFTWRNNRTGSDCIMERIDMAFANSRWRELFDQALVLVDIAVGSDHNPLFLNTQTPLNIVGKPFKFESLWTTEVECRDIIQNVWESNWEGPRMVKFCKKLRGCKVKLKEWHRAKFGDLRFQIAVTKDKLLEVQKQLDEGFNSDLRRQRNQIVRLKDVDGSWKSDPKELGGIIKDHFQSLFAAPVDRNFDDILSLIDSVITPEMNASLTRPILREEVTKALVAAAAAAPVPLLLLHVCATWKELQMLQT
ncbi:hypothetical protein Vadar_007196 [Vaccinium darrowii]|uniref:Uncharacterized protein n=1 Tax=Vaccinium darrowii TaxID=229202 RepID=A0ACB7Z277_9ERIC|nr:hypothetical protein Vadar_007196 [Vaccinium darrowii]